MAKFRTKPVVVEAEQFFPYTHPVEGVVKRIRSVPTFDEFDSPWEYYWGINTLEGLLEVRAGDWIIRGEGEIYSCKSNIFEATYERVETTDD